MSIELVKDFTELAKKMGVYRSALLRRVLESFVLYMNDARAFGKLPTFSAPLGVETWMHEREQIYSYTKDINKMRIAIQNEKDVNNYLNLQIDGSNFLKEASKPNLEFYEISKDVNKPTNNTISIIQKIN